MGFVSETALEHHVTNRDDILGAVVFRLSKHAHRLPRKITYKIRLPSDSDFIDGIEEKIEWKISTMFPDLKKTGPREDNDLSGGKYGGTIPGSCVCRPRWLLMINLFLLICLGYKKTNFM